MIISLQGLESKIIAARPSSLAAALKLYVSGDDLRPHEERRVAGTYVMDHREEEIRAILCMLRANTREA